MSKIYAWMRQLEVTFTSSKLKKSLAFGMNTQFNRDDLYIDVQGRKYMSALKDECTIKLKNLTMSEVVQIVDGEFFDVKVTAGYRSASDNVPIFDGAVMYISNSIDDKKSNTIIILCASKLVAKYGQSRLNLSLNSGINLYSAINFICKRAAIPNTNVSTRFKTKFLKNIENVNSTVGSFIDQLCSNNIDYISNSDGVANSVVSLFDTAKSNHRVIQLRDDNLILRQYPQLRTSGLELLAMPTFSFMCGDTIMIDNSIIQIPVTNKDDISKNYGYFLDKDGAYVIYEIGYSLQNRGQLFELSLKCRSRSLISNISGVV